MRRLGWSFLILLLALVQWAGCGETSSKKIYQVATDATLVPMSFVNDRNQIDGFEADLIREIARVADMQYRLVNVEWAGVIGGVVTKKYDFAISSITILPERKKKVAFSIPYLKSGLAIVVRREMEGVTGMRDLEQRSMKVGAQRGTTADFFLDRHPGVRKVTYEQYGHAVADLIKGEVDAVVGESTGTLYYKTHDNAVFEKIKMTGEIMTDEFYGLIVPLDNPRLLARINAALDQLLHDGTVKRLHARWNLGQAAAVPKG